MPNRSGQREMRVGKAVWIECYDLLVTGEDEDGNEIGLSIGPFRSHEKADAYAQAAYPGFKFNVLPTWEDKRWARFKGQYRPKK